MPLIAELKRRNVFRVGIAYIVFGWLILQVADIVFPALSLPDWAITLVVVLLAIGFLPVLLFSWVYELTPEGLKRESEVDRSTSITHHTAKKLDIVTIGMIIAGIGFVVFYDRVQGPQPALETPSVGFEGDRAASRSVPGGSTAEARESDELSIAVLPFVNLSTDPEQEFFSDGLAESLLHMLAQVRELRVAARTSSFRFKDHTGDISEIGRELKVAHVLEGSVQRAGDTVRVTAQLIKVDNGFHLWSGTYDRKMDDIFGIQDEIANHVVDSLKVTLLGDVQEKISALDTDDPEAYEAYLRGRQQLVINSHVSLPKAREHFLHAIEIDPDYVLAWISLGQTELQLANTGALPVSEMTGRVSDIADRILQLDPDSAPAQAMLAWVTFYTQSAVDADAIFQRAYEQDPEDDFVARGFARFLDWTGREARSVAVASRALERDPVSPLLHMRLAFAYIGLDEYEKAIFHAERVGALEPQDPNSHGIKARIYARLGRYAQAIRAIREARALDPDDYELPADEASYFLAVGDVETAQFLINKSLSIQPDGFLPVVAAAATKYRQGDLESGARMLIKSMEKGMEPRQWGFFVVPMTIRDYALASGHHQAMLEDVAQWLQIDLLEPTVPLRFAARQRLYAVPVARAAGHEEAADALIRAVEDYRRKADDPRIDLDLAIAKQDVDATIQALEDWLAIGVGEWWWLIVESPTMDFVRSDPRFVRLRNAIDARIAAQRAAIAVLEAS